MYTPKHIVNQAVLNQLAATNIGLWQQTSKEKKDAARAARDVARGRCPKCHKKKYACLC